MNQITLTEEEARSLASEDLDGYKRVERGEWICDGKWEYQDLVFEHLETGKFYLQTNARSGSEFTDYEYEADTELQQVEEKQIIVKKWLPVK